MRRVALPIVNIADVPQCPDFDDDCQDVPDPAGMLEYANAQRIKARVEQMIKEWGPYRPTAERHSELVNPLTSDNDWHGWRHATTQYEVLDGFRRMAACDLVGITITADSHVMVDAVVPSFVEPQVRCAKRPSFHVMSMVAPP